MIQRVPLLACFALSMMPEISFSPVAVCVPTAVEALRRLGLLFASLRRSLARCGVTCFLPPSVADTSFSAGSVSRSVHAVNPSGNALRRACASAHSAEHQMRRNFFHTRTKVAVLLVWRIRPLAVSLYNLLAVAALAVDRSYVGNVRMLFNVSVVFIDVNLDEVVCATTL